MPALPKLLAAQPRKTPLVKNIALIWVVLVFTLLGDTTATAQSSPVWLTSAAEIDACATNCSGALSHAVEGDFNNDRKIDVLTTMGGTAAFLAGNGDGTFQNPVLAAYIPTAYNTSIVTGDFNRDGNLDFAYLTDPGPNNVSIFLGDGMGGFTEGATYTVGYGGASLQSLAVANLKKKGELDLVVANNSDQTVSVLLGNGDGTFATPVTYPTGASNLINVVVGDVNGDGLQDVIVSQGDGYTYSVLLGTGKGALGSPNVYSYYDVLGQLNGVILVDVDKNGTLDLLFASTGLSVLLGNGDGTFQSPITYYAQPNGNWISGVGLVALDVNHDGKLDVVMTDGQGNCCNQTNDIVWVFPGNGNGTFGYAQGYAVNYQPGWPLMGDLNGDGAADFVSSGGNPYITVMLGTRTGTFISGNEYAYQNASWAGGIVASDFNNDGNLDVAVGYMNGTISVYPGNTHGTFLTTPISSNIGSSAGVYGWNPGWAPFTANGLAVADMNGDGKKDLVADVIFSSGSCGNGGCEIGVMLNEGSGSFGSGTFYSVGDSAGITGPAVGDLNGDGKPDVVAGNNDGTLSVFINQGAGVLGQATVYSGGSVSPPIVADFNRDGKLDIMTTGCPLGSGDATYLLPGNGDGTFGAPITSAPGACGNSSVAADFNNDGNLDLAVGGWINSGQVQILLGNGDGTFSETGTTLYMPSCLNSKIDPWTMAAADLNGDGKIDLVVTPPNDSWCNEDMGTLVYTGNGDGTFSANLAGAPYLSGPQGGGVVVADFNKDGQPDLAVLDAEGSGCCTYTNSFFTVLLNRTLPATLYPSALTFPKQTVGTVSAPKVITLTNDMDATISITSVAITGADSSDFELTNGCKSTLAPQSNCTLSVKFAPTVPGKLTATLTVTDSASNSPQTVALSGSAQKAAD